MTATVKIDVREVKREVMRRWIFERMRAGDVAVMTRLLEVGAGCAVKAGLHPGQVDAVVNAARFVRSWAERRARRCNKPAADFTAKAMAAALAKQLAAGRVM